MGSQTALSLKAECKLSVYLYLWVYHPFCKTEKKTLPVGYSVETRGYLFTYCSEVLVISVTANEEDSEGCVRLGAHGGEGRDFPQADKGSVLVEP